MNRGTLFILDKSFLFNFNKSCIWIGNEGLSILENVDLTLTRVVFEFFSLTNFSASKMHLTLTRVVFELLCVTIIAVLICYLTLTRVVFEFWL